MGEDGYPRYFAYGGRYIAPAVYIRTDGQLDSKIVDPGGKEVRTYAHVEQWVGRVKCQWMVETTKAEITRQLEEWNRSHSHKMKLPA
jgi:hypothetical protein